MNKLLTVLFLFIVFTGYGQSVEGTPTLKKWQNRIDLYFMDRPDSRFSSSDEVLGGIAAEYTLMYTVSSGYAVGMGTGWSRITNLDAAVVPLYLCTEGRIPMKSNFLYGLMKAGIPIAVGGRNEGRREYYSHYVIYPEIGIQIHDSFRFGVSHRWTHLDSKNLSNRSPTTRHQIFRRWTINFGVVF